MSKKPKYLTLPIYSIATYNQYYIISGGGGGKTGIKNEILIFRHKIQNNKPIFTLQTSNKIIENLQVSPEKKVIFASANQMVKVYDIVHAEEHIMLKEKHQWRADYALKNSTIYSLTFHPQKNILCTAGEDMIIRFFTLDQSLAPTDDKYFEHNLHSNPLKNVDHNNNNLFLSCDTHQVIITDVQTRKPLRRLFCDQLQPQNSLFQAAYFLNPNEQQLLICHYILRKAAYVTKQFKGGKVETKEITTDQSCLTSYSKPLKLLGIACGNGSTHLVHADNLAKAGTEHNHAFVITGGTISRGGRFVTGTPECSYHIQQTDSPMLPCSFTPLIALTLTILIIFLVGSAITLPDITLSDL